MLGFGALVLASSLCLAASGGKNAYAAAPSSVRALFAPPDTLRHTVPAGQSLILALPDTLDARPVATYAPVRLPAMSWLVDRSFLWRTFPRDAGVHEILFEAAFEAAPPETLVVHVTVTR